MKMHYRTTTWGFGNAVCRQKNKTHYISTTLDEEGVTCKKCLAWIKKIDSMKLKQRKENR